MWDVSNGGDVAGLSEMSIPDHCFGISGDTKNYIFIEYPGSAKAKLEPKKANKKCG